MESVQDDDDISLNSTESEQYSSDQEFEVERILAEKKEGNKKLFLIRWENYPVEKSTWEPTSNINQSILVAWKERKKLEQKGTKEAFDVAAFEFKLKQAIKAKAKRHQRRKAERRRRNMTVSPSESEVDNTDDSESSVEAKEDNEIEEVPATKVILKRKKSSSPMKKVVKPFNSVYIAEAVTEESSTYSKSTASGGENLSSDVLTNYGHTRAKSRQDGSGEAPGIQTSRGEKLQQIHSRSESDSLRDVTSKKQRTAQRPNSSSLNGSQDPIHPTANATSQAHFANEPVLGSALGRGHLSIRGATSAARGGRGAMRGGSTTAYKNVFALKNTSKNPGTLLSNAEDVSKNPKIFGNKRLEWTAQKQGRDKAEAAPDISFLPGGLFNPSAPIAPIRPGSFRKLSTCTATNDSSKSEDLFVAAEDTDVPPISQTPATQVSLPKYQVASSNGRYTCYYWDRQQRVEGAGPCMRGTACDFLHAYRAGVPVTAAPPERNTHGHITDNQLTCYFWDKQQHNRDAPSCNKGEECLYFHEYRSGVPVAPPPPGHPRVPSPSATNPQADLVAPDEELNNTPNLTNSVTPSVLQSHAFRTHISTCYYWDKKQRDQREPDCSKGDKCTYLHEYKPDAPIAGPPFRHIEHRQPAAISTSNSAAPPDHNSRDGNLPNASVAISRHAQALSEETHHVRLESHNVTSSRDDLQVGACARPQWDFTQPYNAICYHWLNDGSCNRGPECKYYHRDDDTLPIAPDPNSREAKICRQWLLGKCNYRGCRFLHELLETSKMTSKPPTRTDILANDLEAIGSNSAEPRVKSVRFAGLLRDGFDKGNANDSTNMVSGPQIYSPVDGVTSSTTIGNGNRPLMQAFQEPNSAIEMDVAVGNEKYKIPQLDADHELSSARLQIRKRTPEISSRELDTQPSLVSKTKDVKISMYDYQRKKTLKELGSRGKEVFFGSHETKSVILNFESFETVKHSQLKKAFATFSTVKFGEICMAQDFVAHKGFFDRRKLVQGNLVAGDVDDAETAKALNNTVDELVIRSAGLLSRFKDFAILAYPAKKEEWKSLDEGLDYPSETPLRYFIFDCDSDVSQFPNKETSSLGFGQPYRMTMVERLYGLQLKDLLPYCQPGVNPYNFFLLFPSTAKESEDFIMAWIKAVNSNSKIYSSRNDGAWDYFINTSKIDIGAVLIHESAASEVYHLPSLFTAVNRNPKRTLSFWCVSDSDTLYPLYPSTYSEETPQSGRISLTRLFPRGCAFLVTPSFLIAEPQKAYDLFKWFLSSSKAKYITTTPRSWKLVGCYKLSQYLLDLAISKEEERVDFEAKHYNKPTKDAMLKKRGITWDLCQLRFKTHAILVTLDNRGLLEPPSDPEEDGFETTSRNDSEQPVIYADRSISPDNEPALIKWFAGWTMQKLDIFKKFAVIGTDSSSADRAMRMKQVTKTLVKDDSSPLTLAQNLASTQKALPLLITSKQKALAVAAKLGALALVTQIQRPTSQDQSNTVDKNGDLIMENETNTLNQGGSWITDTDTSDMPPQQDDGPDGRLIEGHEHPNFREGFTPVRQEDKYAMDLDSESDTLDGSERERERAQSNVGKRRKNSLEPRFETEFQEIKYQATTEWYRQFVRQHGGIGWEHIYIAGYEKVFVQIGVNK